MTNKRHIESILKKRDELFGIINPNDYSSEEVKITPTNEVPISMSTVVKAARAQTKNKTDSPETVLRKVKSLDFSNKKLTSINNLFQCSALQFLCLSNNSITSIVGLNDLKQLRILSLESNFIQKIENLSSLSSLEKLYLDRNFITKLEDLEQLGSLQELLISNQQISCPFIFDENSIVGLSSSLLKLSLANNKIEDVSLL